MAKKSFSQTIYAHRRRDTLALLTDVAAAQGRVEGLLGREAYANVATLADGGEYMDTHERLAWWNRMEALVSAQAEGDDPLVSIVYAVAKGRMGEEEAIARLRGLMLLQLAGWAMSEE